MSFAIAIAKGVKLARAIILGANTIEGLQGAAKGGSKRDLALQFATEALGFCQTSSEVPMTGAVRQAMAEYNDAYVKLQNAIAEATGGK